MRGHASGSAVCALCAVVRRVGPRESELVIGGWVWRDSTRQGRKSNIADGWADAGFQSRMSYRHWLDSWCHSRSKFTGCSWASI
jgi:hypothetical protein